MSPAGWSVEQYTLSINQYGDTIDLNMVTSGVGIASQFLANANTNGVQAMQSLDRLARNTLFGGAQNGVGGYLGAIRALVLRLMLKATPFRLMTFGDFSPSLLMVRLR